MSEQKQYKKPILQFQLLFAVLFLFFKTSYCQSYIPMLKSSSEWHVTNCYTGCATDKYYTIGDTLINGFHYHFLDLYHYNKNFVIREDTLAQKIYMRLLSDPVPGKDYLLYDFSLNVGDTMTVLNPGSPYPHFAGIFKVDSIKIKSLVNKNVRYFYLHSQDTLISNTKTTIWVESVGSLCLINTPGAMPQINGVGQLSCFFSNTINEYKQLDSIADCISIYPVGIKDLKKETTYHVTQNFDCQTISINGLLEDEISVKIYSVDGRLELNKENMSNHSVIYIGLYTKGLLLLKIESKTGVYSTYKLFNP